MTISAADLEYRLSGGAANTDPALSLGGAMSTDPNGRVFGQSATAPLTIGGVTIEDVEGNAEGIGLLTFIRADDTLAWTPPGGLIGTPVDVNGGGRFTLRGADSTMYITVDVNWGTLDLEVSDLADNITVAWIYVELFDHVDKDESLVGDTEYRCFYLLNDHATDDAVDVLFWIHQDTNGDDTLAIALDPAGVGGVATTAADENSAPVGPVFTSPSTEGSGLSLGTIPAGDFYPLWIRRTVPAGADPQTFDRSKLRFSAQF